MRRAPRLLLTAAAVGGSLGAGAMALAAVPEPVPAGSTTSAPRGPVEVSTDVAALEAEHQALLARTEALTRQVTAATQALLAEQRRASQVQAPPPSLVAAAPTAARRRPGAAAPARTAPRPAPVVTTGATAAPSGDAEVDGAHDD